MLLYMISNYFFSAMPKRKIQRHKSQPWVKHIVFVNSSAGLRAYTDFSTITSLALSSLPGSENTPLTWVPGYTHTHPSFTKHFLHCPTITSWYLSTFRKHFSSRLENPNDLELCPVQRPSFDNYILLYFHSNKSPDIFACKKYLFRNLLNICFLF